LEAAA
jgi:hypothetical protein